MNKINPLVSVLICTYNAERFISNTIKSVLNQDYSNLEILVIDNNSSDKTLKVLEEFSKLDSRLKVFAHKKNLGAYGGLNYLLDLSSGKYISIIDHDDIWRLDKTTKQVNFMEVNYDKYVGCGSRSILFFEKDDQFYLLRQFSNTVTKVVPHPSIFFKNNKKFRYNLDVHYKTDVYFMKHNLCKKSNLYLFNDFFYIHRMRGDGKNLSKTRKFSGMIKYFFQTKEIMTLIKGLILYSMPSSFTDLYYKKIVCIGDPIIDIEVYYFNKNNI